MEKNGNLKKTAISAACAMVLALMTNGVVFAQQNDLEIKAKELVAGRLGVSPDALAVENMGVGNFDLQKVVFYDFKFTLKETGSLYSVVLDDSGAEIDLEELTRKEQDNYVSKYGRVDKRLVDTLAQTDPRTAVDVVIWANQSRDVSLKRPDSETSLDDKQIDSLYAQLDAERAEIARESTSSLVSKLAAEGLDAEADTLTSAVSVSIPAGDIRRISEWADVSSVYQAETFDNKLAISGNTIAAYAVHATGNSGQGVRVGVVEVGGRIDLANPWLAGITPDNINSCYNNHGTNVVGVIRSTHPTQRGIAPAATVRVGGSCTGNETQLRDASNRASVWGARALNLSFGRDGNRNVSSFDRFYDTMVEDGWRTVVVAAGNNNPPFGTRTGNVGTPGLAYNVITVGSFNDRSTPWTISNFSSWRNPNSQHGDREKPEVAAPGSNIQMPSSNGLGFNSGTSFAAPMVTGMAALMMRSHGSLTVWPEAVKAIAMATATSNIEGATRLSEFDGAGGVNATRATRVAVGVTGNWGGRSYTCGAAALTDVTTFSLSSGRRVRVAMAWDANTSFWNFSYASRPGADLDMQIIGPTGSVVTGSYSWDNTYEIVDFVAPTTGTYRLRVNKFRCNHSPKWLGWAWHTV